MLQIYILMVLGLISSSTEDKMEFLPFNLDEPSLKIELSKELKEISGLSWVDHQIGAIQDEAGILYLIDPKTGKTTEKLKFALPGDFEGIENINNVFYALTSSGTIYKFNINAASDARRITTPFTRKNDTEGITYNELTNELLIACKENGSVGKYITEKRAIYALDLSTNTICPFPVITTSLADIRKFTDVEKFKPSALAIDPLTCNIYLLGSVGKLLLIYDQNYNLLEAKKLSGKMHKQPEGICFSPLGDLYISNEGTDKHKSNIYHFTRL